LPCPDLSDPVLVEKKKSLDSIAGQQQKNRSNHADGPLPLDGRNYYKNLCMRAVNQSVGRAFRHADDYAAAILAYYRYSSDSSVWNKLPNWLQNSRDISRRHSYSNAVVELKKFFNEKKGSSV